MKILINFVKKAFYFTLLIQVFFWFNAYYRTGKIDQISLFFNVDHALFSIKVFFIYLFLKHHLTWLRKGVSSKRSQNSLKPYSGQNLHTFDKIGNMKSFHTNNEIIS